MIWSGKKGVERRVIQPYALRTPTGLAASNITAYTIDLSWDATGDAANYRLYRDGVLVASPTSSPYTDTGLAASTSYSYTVSAVSAGGESAQSAAVNVTTQTDVGANLVLDADYSTRALLPMAEKTDELNIRYTHTLLPTGGPSGQPAFLASQLSALGLSDNGGQYTFGHDFQLAIPTGQSRFFRMRIKVGGDWRAANWSGTPTSTYPRNKWMILSNGTASRVLWNIDCARYYRAPGSDGHETWQFGGARTGVAVDAGRWWFNIKDGGAVSPAIGYRDVWHNLQIEWRPGPSGVWKCWLDNSTYASPTWDAGNPASTPSNPDIGFGLFMNEALEVGGSVTFAHSDFEIGTTFNPGW